MLPWNPSRFDTAATGEMLLILACGLILLVTVSALGELLDRYRNRS